MEPFHPNWLIVFEPFERFCEKVQLTGDLRIDHRIGDL